MLYSKKCTHMRQMYLLLALTVSSCYADTRDDLINKFNQLEKSSGQAELVQTIRKRIKNFRYQCHLAPTKRGGESLRCPKADEITAGMIEKPINFEDAKYFIDQIKAAEPGVALDEANLSEMVQKHLVEPCKKFIKTFGEPVFLEAEKTDPTLSSWNKYIFSPQRQFYIAWGGFKLCQYTTKSAEQGELVESLKKELK